jgi:hypothetical protein
MAVWPRILFPSMHPSNVAGGFRNRDPGIAPAEVIVGRPGAAGVRTVLHLSGGPW